MYCKECGFQLSDDAKFCPNCGTKVELNGVSNIEDNAVWGNIENDETEEGVSSQIFSKAHWGGDVSKDNNNGRYMQSSVEQRKIIRKEETSIESVYVAYWSYEYNEESVLSPQWYVDSNGRGISNVYDYCSRGIEYDLTFVKKNSMWACCELIDGHMTELTPFVFEDFDLDFHKDKKFSEYNIEVYSIVLYKGDWHLIDSNMRLYKQTKSWWPSIVGNLIYALGITFMIWFGLFMLDISGEWWNSLVKSYWLYIVIFAIILIISTLKDGPTYGLKEIRRF